MILKIKDEEIKVFDVTFDKSFRPQREMIALRVYSDDCPIERATDILSNKYDGTFTIDDQSYSGYDFPHIAHKIDNNFYAIKFVQGYAMPTEE